MKTPPTVTRRQRRFFVVLPLLVLPFLAMAFWAMGGGGGAPLSTGLTTGLNLQLPAPQLEAARQQDKLSLYEEVRKRLRASSPGRQRQFRELVSPGSWSADTSGSHRQAGMLPPAATTTTSPPETHEARITERLTRLTALVNREHSSARAEKQTASTSPVPPSGNETALGQDIDRLERLMQGMSGPPVPADPEVQQLEGMLDRILDIQHPERVRARLLQQSRENSRQLFPLQPLPARPAVTLLGTTQDTAMPGSGPLSAQHGAANGTAPGAFHGLGDSQPQETAAGNYLAAVIREKQKVTNGSTVHLRLLQEAYLGGHHLPAGTTLHGTCRLQGERLFITIAAARAGGSLFPVALSAHDLDGVEGLYVPGAPGQQAASEGAQQVLGQGLPLPALSPSPAAQAASAGIEAARSLFRRKARAAKVTLLPGHRLLLLDQQASR